MNTEDKQNQPGHSVNRREFVGTAMLGVASVLPVDAAVQQSPSSANGSSVAKLSCSLKINGQQHDVQVDPRTTVLDLLRENLQMTGTKKGCDHGQCGACTVLMNGQRVNSCLTLAIMHDGHEITTVEGLADPKSGQLHPVQAAFIEHDGFQCGYCTPGQICSAVGMLGEVHRGAASAVTANLAQTGPVDLTDDEIRERMSGNLCRCGAYVGIVAAVRQAHSEVKA